MTWLFIVSGPGYVDRVERRQVKAFAKQDGTGDKIMRLNSV